MSLINTQILPFNATAYYRGEFVEISHEMLLGGWSAIVFYPADFTYVCPTELEDLAANHSAFVGLGAEIYAVSTDTHFAHKAWHDSSPAVGKVRYPLIGDPTGSLARNFGVFMADTGLAQRATFLIDPSGLIKWFEVLDNSLGRDAQDLLRKIKAAQYVAEHAGEVCPAAWTENGRTIKASLELVGKI